MHKRISATLIAGLALTALVGCSGSDGTSTSPTSGASPASTTSSARDPEVQEAIDAYEAFRDASNAAREHPVGKGKKLPASADFERWSYDPARVDTLVYVHALAAYNAEYRGREARSHVKVQQRDLEASPYPRVVLADCLVPQGEYVPFNKKTGKRLRLVEGQDLDEPYLSTIELIAVKGRWGVKTLAPQQEGTCEP